MGMLLWYWGTIPVTHGSTQGSHLHRKPDASRLKFSLTNPDPGLENASIDKQLFTYKYSSSEPGSLGMLRTKLLGVLSKYGPYLVKELQYTAGALTNLSFLNGLVDLIPIEGELCDQIFASPQRFVNARAKACEVKVHCLKVTKGNVFTTFYTSNRRSVNAGPHAADERVVLNTMHEHLGGQMPICSSEASTIIEGSQLLYPNGFVLFVVDQEKKRVFLAVLSSAAFGKFENVFNLTAFDSFIRKLSGGTPSTADVKRHLGIYGCMSYNRNVKSLQDLVEDLRDPSSFNHLKFDLSSIGDQQKPREIFKKISSAFTGQKDSSSRKNAQETIQGMDIYDAGGLLTGEFIRAFVENPKQSASQLAGSLYDNVCCVIVESGKVTHHNFFPSACHFQYDPTNNRFISEIVDAGRLSDQHIMQAFKKWKLVDSLKNGRILFLVVDKDTQQIYLIFYRP